jgi:hypothetical protein
LLKTRTATVSHHRRNRNASQTLGRRADGITQAAPASALGKDVRTLKDAKGSF